MSSGVALTTTTIGSNFNYPSDVTYVSRINFT